MKIILKDTFILVGITFILVLILPIAKTKTQSIIDNANQNSKNKIYKQVCSIYFDSEIIKNEITLEDLDVNARLTNENSLLRCKNEDDEIVGYIVEVTSKGFGGDLNLIVGFDINCNIAGVCYADTPSETPGIGMKTTESSFLNTWISHNKNDVDEVQGISGATISSTGFKNAIKLACLYLEKISQISGEN